MIPILLVMLVLLSAWHTAAAALWTLPAGIKTIDVNGYPMAFLESGTGESVVLVHGAGGDYRSWARQVASPPRGFRLIAVSLRHYYPERWDGKGDTFSVRQHAEDLVIFIEALGVGPVYLVAHSRGGSVAVRTAQARPALVKKLVLMEGAFGPLLQKPTSDEAGPGLSPIAKAVKARFDQGDIEGGLELWSDRDEPGSWARRSEEDRQKITGQRLGTDCRWIRLSRHLRRLGGAEDASFVWYHHFLCTVDHSVRARYLLSP